MTFRYNKLESLSEPDVLNEVAKILTYNRGFHDGVILEVFKRLEYEKIEHPQLGQVVVDAGAGIGTFTVKASLQVGNSGFVYAFEPEPENFKLLKINTQKLNNVKIHNQALWSSPEIKLFYLRSDHWAGHNLYNWGLIKKKIKVETVALDEALNKKVDFLKIDVELAELEVLKGAKRILREDKPFVAVEIHSRLLFKEVSEFLNGFGYKIVGNINRYNTGIHYFKI